MGDVQVSTSVLNPTLRCHAIHFGTCDVLLDFVVTIEREHLSMA